MVPIIRTFSSGAQNLTDIEVKEFSGGNAKKKYNPRSGAPWHRERHNHKKLGKRERRASPVNYYLCCEAHRSLPARNLVSGQGFGDPAVSHPHETDGITNSESMSL
jgi:hypothetical protein